jgi:hypothetical protein
MGRIRAPAEPGPEWSIEKGSALVDDGLDVGVRLVQESVDVRVLVGEDGLHDGVEGRVELLRCVGSVTIG